LQRRQVEKTVAEVMADPALQPARRSFIRALAQTIGNEYKDPDYADEEVQIAVWRAAVSALYHKPAPAVIQNQGQRKKFFQEWIFNSLKQILKENRIPQHRSVSTVCGPNLDLGAEIFCDFLRRKGVPIISVARATSRLAIIRAEITRLSLNDLQSLWRVEKLLRSGGLRVRYDEENLNEISIHTRRPTIVKFQIPTASHIKLVSFETQHKQESSDDLRYVLEYKLASDNLDPTQRAAEFNDVVSLIRSRLPADAREAMNIIINPPPDFIRLYGDDVRQHTLANFLGKSQKEMARIFGLIRLQCEGAGLGCDASEDYSTGRRFS
jgi:hypothetical protein